MSFFSEFKKFAMRGNMIDMAVGIIIGGAFTPIVNSLVNDIIMPPIGLLFGGVDFSNLAVTLKQATENGDPAVVIRYGVFINTIIAFLIVAMAVFVLIKFINRLTREEKEQPAAPSAEETLLTEIRDLLKDKK